MRGRPVPGTVPRGRSFLSLIHIYGQDLVHVVLHDGAGDALFTGQHGIRIALNGVDLTVVQDKTVGVGAHPAGVGVGGEAAVHHANGLSLIHI